MRREKRTIMCFECDSAAGTDAESTCKEEKAHGGIYLYILLYTMTIAQSKPKKSYLISHVQNGRFSDTVIRSASPVLDKHALSANNHTDAPARPRHRVSLATTPQQPARERRKKVCVDTSVRACVRLVKFVCPAHSFEMARRWPSGCRRRGRCFS